jgi:alkylation response protein AidB-like acyl-CoA dehydrogenase
MDFELNDEQRQLSDSLERLLTQQYDLEQRKAIIQSQGSFSQAIWSKLADLGILSLPVSEAAGGFGGGAVDLMRPMGLVGQALLLEPLIEHLTASRLLDRALASDPAASGHADNVSLLQQAVSGECRLAWARSMDGDNGDACTARRSGDSWRLEGRFTSVPGADGASHLLVAARDGSDFSLFIVATSTPSVTLRPGSALDNRRIADIEFAGVDLPQGQRIAGGSGAAAALEDAADFGSAMLCAEAAGIIDYACQATLEYLKTRKQFGVPIGSFQALQHRIVDLYVDLEQVRSMAALACSKCDAAAAGQISLAERTKAIAAARVLVGKAATKVAQESVQLHGGMGMAEEMKISHAFRRLTVLGRQFGTVDFFLDRFIAADRSL